MARRRLIDPAVWQSGHFKRLNLRQRLLWIGVITLADDTGKLKGEPAAVKATLFPFDAVSRTIIEADLQQLQGERLIERYEVDGDRYIRIAKWDKYQRPSHPTPSKIPNPRPDVRLARGAALEQLQNPSGTSLEQVREGQDNTEEGREEQVNAVSEPTASSAPAEVDASASPATPDDRAEAITFIETQAELDLLRARSDWPHL